MTAASTLAACGSDSRQSPTVPTSTGGTGGPPTGVSSGTLAFRTSPIAQSAILWITPLGNLNPPSHTLPTDHIYFYFANPDAGESPIARRTEFMAPGDGTVTTIFGGGIGSESRIYV